MEVFVPWSAKIHFDFLLSKLDPYLVEQFDRASLLHTVPVQSRHVAWTPKLWYFVECFFQCVQSYMTKKNIDITHDIYYIDYIFLISIISYADPSQQSHNIKGDQMIWGLPVGPWALSGGLGRRLNASWIEKLFRKMGSWPNFKCLLMFFLFVYI